MTIQSQSASVYYSRPGKVKARLLYVFDDGRQFAKNVTASSEAEINNLLTTRATLAQAEVSKMDAMEAASKNLKVAYGEATQKQVYAAYAELARESDDPAQIYELLSEIPQTEHCSECARRWAIVKNYATELQRYKTLRGAL